MEKDFLGINGKDSCGVVKDEGRGIQKNSVFVGGPTVQMPFSNRVAYLQHLKFFKAIQDKKPKNAAFDHLSSAGFHPIISSTVKEAPQQRFGLDRQGAHHFSTHAYQPQRCDTFGASSASRHVVSHPSSRLSIGNPFIKVHCSSNDPNLSVANYKQQSLGGFIVNNHSLMGSGFGTFVPRNVSKPTSSSQVTIFYAGSVNVYDDVPPDKAQAIMLMASKASNTTSNNPNQRPKTPFSSLNHIVPGVNGLNVNHTLDQTGRQTQNASQVSSPVSDTSHMGAQSRCNSSTNDVAGMKNVGPLSPDLCQHELLKATINSTPIAPMVVPQVSKASVIAVPQARKASLARFLEKRKERVISAKPYPCAKKSYENLWASGVPMSLANAHQSIDLSSPSNREENSIEIPSTQT